MVNEKRLIDANALKEKLQEHHDFFVDVEAAVRVVRKPAAVRRSGE